MRSRLSRTRMSWKTKPGQAATHPTDKQIQLHRNSHFHIITLLTFQSRINTTCHLSTAIQPRQPPRWASEERFRLSDGQSTPFSLRSGLPSALDGSVSQVRGLPNYRVYCTPSCLVIWPLIFASWTYTLDSWWVSQKFV
jgi:hypothetical protein